MSLKQIEAVRVFDKWALGIHLSPSGSVLVTGMNGEVVELDQSLAEVRRWQAHDGAVNCLRVINGQVWTGGGDNLLKVWSGERLEAQYEGPKKPVTSVFIDGDDLVAQSYDRAAWVWSLSAPSQAPRKIKDVASLVQTDSGFYGSPKTGSKAGEIGPLAAFDLASGSFDSPLFEDGFGVWSLQDVPSKGLLAFGLDTKAYWVDPVAVTRSELPWHSKSVAPHFRVLADGSELYFGDGKIYHNGKAQDGPIKGLYCAVQLDDGRVAISGADGQVWVFEVD
ncbi:MAG: hypothetical protein ACPG4M_04145 [Alphaproteobacteria bacterium]